ncbi:tyrosine-protein phosphatase [Propioniciclava soli]|uniref:tyrosine-protein phosphatase n=1 Tax=Propioniciclava soli TaxID=2775081 RepID=UPI001E42E829|nr:tyrosine-protein phosphatase [Propioniciclava soli]
MTLRVDGLLNLRDLGGTPTGTGATVQPGRLWRSENQTLLTPAALDALVEQGLSDVIDLRTDFEVNGSPSPFAERAGVAYHHLSYFPTAADDDADVLDQALPWVDNELKVTPVTGNEHADGYLMFLAMRPDSVIAALRAIAGAEGAALVHCAVGRDRTGFTVALALALVGVADDVIAADYARTADAIVDVIANLWKDPTYEAEAGGRIDPDAVRPTPEPMLAILDHLTRTHGSVRAALTPLGWTDADQAALERHLLDA